MIYIKRLCFCIVAFSSLVLAIMLQILLIVSTPIWGILYYIISGKDPIIEGVYNIIIESEGSFLNWYKNKFGPNDD